MHCFHFFPWDLRIITNGALYCGLSVRFDAESTLLGFESHLKSLVELIT